MTYTARDIARIFDLNPKSVYAASEAGHIKKVEGSKPAAYTKESVDKYWGRRLKELNVTNVGNMQEFIDHTLSKLDNLDQRLVRLENDRS